eukprot:jgi/Astpho2/7192/e_gw1.00113.157.1_t
MPYSDDRKWTVRQHLLDVVQEFPTLVLKAQTYTYPDGRSATLLMVEGTLPMYYQGVKYNIPVAIWLTEQYPQQAPLTYVVPTPDMIIKPRHSFVDASGVVNTPYLQHWSPQLCNLVDMGHDTSIQFGQDPPLFRLPAAGARPVPTPPAAMPVPVPPHLSFLLQAAFRKAAIAALTRRLQSSIAAANADAAAEMDSLFETQGKLTRREEEIQKGVAALQKERQALEACVLSMSGKTVALERWLEENEAKLPQGEINPDEAIVAADSLSQQALEAQAEDLAIEDTLYALERALTNGVITADAYLKQVRLICRKQFFVRALGMKVASKQHEVARHSQNRTRHERSPQTQSVQMPQGDSWANTGILANPLQAR